MKAKTKKTHFSKKNITKKNITKKMKKDQCAPKTSFDFTCYNSEALHKMKDLWNKRHSDKKIHSNDPKEIWRYLKYFLSNSCNRESCWLRQNFIKHNLDKNLLNYTFAPKYPKEWEKNPDEWLNSIDILNVMSQYEKKYSCFEFLGPSPIDYDTHKLYGECVWEELCKFNLNQYLKNGKTKIGVIFNLDEHTEDGSHWVALFINTKKNMIYYFDSYGDKIPNKIKKFVDMVKKQSGIIGEQYKFTYNKMRHQYKESECGMYSIYFIIKMLDDKSFTYFLDNSIPDKEMIKLRKKYFNY